MTGKNEQVTPAPVHSDPFSGLGQAAGEIEKPAHTITLRARGQFLPLINRPDIRAQATSFSDAVNACTLGGVHIRRGFYDPPMAFFNYSGYLTFTTTLYRFMERSLGLWKALNELRR